MSVHSHHWGDF